MDDKQMVIKSNNMKIFINNTLLQDDKHIF